MAALTREEVAEWLAASCEHQGVDVSVTNAETLGRIAAVLGPPSGGPAARVCTGEMRADEGHETVPARISALPSDGNPPGVELVVGTRCGSDLDTVEDLAEYSPSLL